MSKKTKVKAKRPSSKYTIAYFFKKFSAIPAAKWTTGSLEKNGASCALGHTGMRVYVANPEAKALAEILRPVHEDLFKSTFKSGSHDVCVVYDLNDGASALGSTPKERILTALAKAATL